MSGYVYIMAGKPRGAIYIGVTSDIAKRVFEHRSGKQHGFTSRYKLFNLVWFEKHPNIVLAIQREKSLKRYKRDWKLNLIEQFNPSWRDLFDEIDQLENDYIPHPNTSSWKDYN